jgi:hypothetical protein
MGVGAGRSVLSDRSDDIEEPRDLVLEKVRNNSNGSVVGDGSGVMSNIAAICGDDMEVPGDTSPAEECSRARMLGGLRERLEAELLDRNCGSGFIVCGELDG